MAISLQLIALRDMLHAQMNQAVFIGRPDKNARGLYLWPWKLDVKANLSNTPPARQRNVLRTEKPELRLEIRLFVLSVAGSEIKNCDNLTAALRAMTDHPILVAAETRGQLRIDSMGTDELTAIFTAAGLPLIMCLACRVEITS